MSLLTRVRNWMLDRAIDRHFASLPGWVHSVASADRPAVPGGERW